MHFQEIFSGCRSKFSAHSFVALLLVVSLTILRCENKIKPLKANITPHISYIEDKNEQLVFEKINSAKAHEWQFVRQPAFDFGFSKSVYWLKIDLSAMPDFSALKRAYLVFEWKALDSVQLFLPQHPSGKNEIQVAGDAFPKSQWNLPEAHFPAFMIHPLEAMQKIWYVRLKSTSLMSFPVFVKNENTYLKDLKREVISINIYLIVVLLLVILAFFLFFMSRDRTYLLYAGYIFSIAAGFDIIYGNAFDLFWSETTWWQNRAGFTFLGIQIAFSALFVSRLLDFPRLLPIADRACKTIAIFCAIIAPLTLLDIPIIVFSRLYSFIYMLSIPSFFAVGIYLASSARSHIRFFIIGWGVFFFFGALHILHALGVLLFHNLYVYGVIFALPVDIIFFLASIWEKQRNFDNERKILLAKKIEATDREVLYKKSSLAEIDTAEILTRLKILMEKEKLFLIEDLRLPDLAQALHLNRTQLSEFLNSKFKMNFSNFVNHYRIDEAKKLLIEDPSKNILEIAFASGFGSKATFNAEFKRATGITASEYRTKHLYS